MSSRRRDARAPFLRPVQNNLNLPYPAAARGHPVSFRARNDEPLPVRKDVVVPWRPEWTVVRQLPGPHLRVAECEGGLLRDTHADDRLCPFDIEQRATIRTPLCMVSELSCRRDLRSRVRRRERLDVDRRRRFATAERVRNPSSIRRELGVQRARRADIADASRGPRAHREAPQRGLCAIDRAEQEEVFWLRP